MGIALIKILKGEKSQGFKLSRSKTRYIECNFSTNAILRIIIKLEEKEIATNGCFKYFEYIFQSM